MEERPKLTDRQQQILDLVQSAIARTGAPPTRAEIAAELGFRSPNAAEEHLQALARKGVIELVGGTSRGIRLQAEALKKLNQARGKQFSLPLPSLSQLTLPLVGRVAAGSPILAQEHIDQTYVVEASMFARKPDYLLRALVYVAANCYSAIGIIDYPERWLGKSDKDANERLRAGARRRLHKMWSAFADSFVGDKPSTYLFGDRIGAADLMMAVVSRWSGTRKHLAKNRPAMAALVDRVEAHPVVAAVIARHWGAGLVNTGS
jgi:SOS regulatory protein LexA